jgi:hypothetical protein
MLLAYLLFLTLLFNALPAGLTFSVRGDFLVCKLGTINLILVFCNSFMGSGYAIIEIASGKVTFFSLENAAELRLIILRRRE